MGRLGLLAEKRLNRRKCNSEHFQIGMVSWYRVCHREETGKREVSCHQRWTTLCVHCENTETRDGKTL